MALVVAVEKGQYADSVRLMKVTTTVNSMSGVKRAAALMGTESNKRLLREAGLWTEEIRGAGVNDLIIAVEADSQTVAAAALEQARSLLFQRVEQRRGPERYPHQRLALAALPAATVAVISIPGPYAKLEAATALEHNLHVFLFSDNVPLEEEVELKARALRRGLLLMGPGCGTAILGGTRLGFANRVRSGVIGVVGAAGTGIQEVTSLIHNAGEGISHAIGVGGRDLSEAVGGVMMAEGIRRLMADEATKVLLLVSKPPSQRGLDAVMAEVDKGSKPTILAFLEAKGLKGDGRISIVSTLEEAALQAVALARGLPPGGINPWAMDLSARAKRLGRALSPGQQYVRGIFSGGTLCYEAMLILGEALGGIFSNVSVDPSYRLMGGQRSVGHTCIDMGEEEFTSGRPHPMIDSTLRAARLRAEAADPKVAVILFDLILGDGASSNPAAELIPAVREAAEQARRQERRLHFVAHVCGTDGDPQDRAAQERALTRAGVIVLPTNAQAARLAALIVQGRGGLARSGGRKEWRR
jgi:FdrA protein